MTIGFPVAFQLFGLLVFKLPFPFISPFTFPIFLIHCFESLLPRLFLLPFCFSDSDLCCTFSRYVSPSPSLLLPFPFLLYSVVSL